MPVIVDAPWLADTRGVWDKIIDKNEREIGNHFIRCLETELEDNLDPSEPYKFRIGTHTFVLYPFEPAEEE